LSRGNDNALFSLAQTIQRETSVLLGDFDTQKRSSVRNKKILQRIDTSTILMAHAIISIEIYATLFSVSHVFVFGAQASRRGLFSHGVSKIS
jgi:hypothetical protein